MLKIIWEKIAVFFLVGYINFVYRTSKIIIYGDKEVLTQENREKVIALFWHGDTYCLYPALKGSKLYVAVTRDRRGDYITEICNHYGYQTIRVPDISDGGNYLFKIRDIVNNKDVSNLAISLDGPLGPYHVPKDFSFVTALLTKRKLMPVAINVKRKIEFRKRWDNYKLPLPFNEIILDFHEPIEVTSADKNEKFESIKRKVKMLMEDQSIEKEQSFI